MVDINKLEELRRYAKGKLSAPYEIREIVEALIKLGQLPFVLTDVLGNRSLGTASVTFALEDTTGIAFERWRPLTEAEAQLARDAGAGEFIPPHLPTINPEGLHDVVSD